MPAQSRWPGAGATCQQQARSAQAALHSAPRCAHLQLPQVVQPAGERHHQQRAADADKAPNSPREDTDRKGWKEGETASTSAACTACATAHSTACAATSAAMHGLAQWREAQWRGAAASQRERATGSRQRTGAQHPLPGLTTRGSWRSAVRAVHDTQAGAAVACAQPCGVAAHAATPRWCSTSSHAQLTAFGARRRVTSRTSTDQEIVTATQPRAPLRLRGAARRAAAARAAWRRRGRPMAPRRMRRSRPAACARRGAGVASARARRRRQRASLGWSSATRWTRTAPSSGAQRASSRLGCRKGRARCFVRRRDAARGRAPATRRRAACHRSALLRRGRARRCRPHTRSALNLRCTAQSGVRGPCWPVAGLDRAPQSAAGALSPARRCLPRSRAAARGCRLAELAPCRSHRTLTACASRCAADDHGGLREDGGHARECAPSRAPRPRRAEGSRAAPA